MTITGLPQDFHRDRTKLETCGYARTGVEVKVLESGEIVTRSECVMAGYWDNPDATAQALRGGWLHTGDIGSMDERGFLTSFARFALRTAERNSIEMAINAFALRGDSRPVKSKTFTMAAVIERSLTAGVVGANIGGDLLFFVGIPVDIVGFLVAMTLATVGADGRPSTRVVLIKGFDARGLVWYSNYGSRKGRELAANPFAPTEIVSLFLDGVRAC